LDGRNTLPKGERLQRTYQFRRVYESGRKARADFAVVYVLESAAKTGSGAGALGVVTSRKVGCAVVRNRARRLLREAYRLNKHKLKPNLQIVIVARAGIRGRRLQDIEAVLLELLGRAGGLAPKAFGVD
jgi:ribonuclease P protein component